MSYILDALKKSEQERGHGSAPSVQTLHSSNLNYHPDKTPIWPYFLLAAIVINLAALFYFILTKSDAGTPMPEQRSLAEMQAVDPGTSREAAEMAASAAMPAPDPADSIVYKPVSMPEASSNAVAAGPRATGIKAPPPQYTGGTVVEMDELPFDMLQHIPTLEFSAHVYSSNPLQRSIVINGRFMEEGDYLAAGLFLSEITPDGAIFDYQGQLFRRNVVSAWN